MKKNLSRILFAAALCSVLSASLLSCKNLFSNKTENNSIDNKEKLYEISGRIFADYEDFNSSSRNALALASDLECVVTVVEAEVNASTGVWSPKSTGLTYTAASDAGGNFTVKLKQGKWLLSASNTGRVLETPSGSETKVDINATDFPAGYKDDIEIIIKPKMTTGSTPGTGLINLTITNQVSTINTLRISKYESGTYTNLQTLSVSGGHFIWQESSMDSGAYRILFEFFTEASASITSTTIPAYSCEEAINVFDDLTTSTWVKNSTSENAQPHLTLKAAASQTIPNEADFILTNDCINLFKSYAYEVSSALQLNQSVEKILAQNNADTTTSETNRPEYKIILTSDITYTSETDFTTITSPAAFSVAACLNSTQPLKIAFIGKGQLRTINLDSSSSLPAATNICGIYANENTSLTLNNICIKGVGTLPTANLGVNPGTSSGSGTDTAATLDNKIAVWADGNTVSGAWKSARVMLKNKVLIKDNECNLKFTKVYGGTGSTAPLIIDESLTSDSRLGLSFGFEAGTYEAPATVTSGFSAFSARTGVSNPDELFFADRGFFIVLTSSGNEVTWVAAGGQGSIVQKLKDDMYFMALVGADDDETTGKITFDSTENRFYIGYGHDDVYIKPQIKMKSGNGYTDLSPSPAISFNLFYANGEPVPASKSVGGAYVSVWQVTDGQFYIKELTEDVTENTLMPPGKYILTTTASYDGVEYKASWDISYIKITCELDRPRIKVKAPSSERVINLIVTVDDGEIRDVSAQSSRSIRTNGNPYGGGNPAKNPSLLRASTSLIDTSTGGFSQAGCAKANNSYLTINNTDKSLTLTDSGVAMPYLYYYSADVSYKGLYCYAENETVTRAFSVDDSNAFYYAPGITIKSDLFSTDLQELVNKVIERNKNGVGKNWSDEYTIYLLTDAVATDDNIQTDSTGKSFIKVENAEATTKLKLTFKTYKLTNPFTINANKKARVMNIGANADITLDTVRLCGGNNSTGSAIMGAQGSNITIRQSVIGEDTDYPADNTPASFSNYTISTGSVIYIDSENVSGKQSTLTTELVVQQNGTQNNIYPVKFCCNYGGIIIQAGTNLQMSGLVLAKNYVASALVSIQGTLASGSYIKNTDIYNNRVGTSSLIEFNHQTNTGMDFLLEDVKIHENYLCDSSGNYEVCGIYCNNAGETNEANTETGKLKLTMNNCHVYKNNVVNSSSNPGIAKLSAIKMQGGTLNLHDCTFTELSATGSMAVNTIAVEDTNKWKNIINLNGKFYTDGDIFLSSPYTGNYGTRLNLTGNLELPSSSQLNAISGNTYDQVNDFATLVLDSTTPGTRILSSDKISYLGDSPAKIKVRSNESANTNVYFLNDRGELKERATSSSSTSSSEIPEDFELVPRANFNGAVTLCAGDTNKQSQVFIQGRRLALPDLIACDHEVTQGEYEKYCDYYSNTPSINEGKGIDYPAYYVNWYDAILYCNVRSLAEGLTPCYSLKVGTTDYGTNPDTWTSCVSITNGIYKYTNYTNLNFSCDWNANGYRLPTRAEWEYLGRGGNLSDEGQTVFSGTNGGDSLEDYAWCVSNSEGKTHPVKGKLPNALELYDMTGNVAEWCWDSLTSGSVIDANTPATGISSGNLRNTIGGNWKEDHELCISGSAGPGNSYNFIGFRVVRNASPAGQFYETEQTSTTSPAVAAGMVYVPGGVFNSSTTLCDGDTDRQSSVFIANRIVPIGAIYACDHEVTQGEYEKFMTYYGVAVSGTDAGQSGSPDFVYAPGTNSSVGGVGKGTNYPVYFVNKYEAIMYCNLRSEAEGLTPAYYLEWAGTQYTKVSEWAEITDSGLNIGKNTDGKYYYASKDKNQYFEWGDNINATDTKGIKVNPLANGYRLPTLAEWEYLARGGNLKNAGQTIYSGSDDITLVAWCLANAGSQTHPVKGKQPNALNLYDMTGNISEWCWDWDSSITVNTPVTGAATGGTVVYCGGQFNSNPDKTLAEKAGMTASDRYKTQGFRVVRNAPDYGYVFVEGGTVVGSDEYNQRRADGENYIGAFPAGRTVTLSSFYICDHELTQGEYETYCCYTSSTPSSSYGDGADYPAYYVSWYDAIVYCNLRSMAENLTPCYALGDETDPTKWDGIKSSNGKYSCSYTSSNETWNSITCDITASGYRLPTEAEWEYAARGGQETYGTTVFANYFAGATTTNYSASSNSDLDSVGWYKYNICNNGVTGSEGSSGDAGYGTHEVKKKAPNALGLYDMSGNVYEWCWDWKGSISTSETVTDPCGASSGSYRFGRGGGWNGNAYNCSVSYRGGNCYPSYRYYDSGFRLVRSAE